MSFILVAESQWGSHTMVSIQCVKSTPSPWPPLNDSGLSVFLIRLQRPYPSNCGHLGTYYSVESFVGGQLCAEAEFVIYHFHRTFQCFIVLFIFTRMSTICQLVHSHNVNFCQMSPMQIRHWVGSSNPLAQQSEIFMQILQTFSFSLLPAATVSKINIALNKNRERGRRKSREEPCLPVPSAVGLQDLTHCTSRLVG